jgi:hypothetical protein
MHRWLWSLSLTVSLFGCGPDKRPEEPCDGPSFNLVVTAEGGPLPADTRINVRYGSNQKGEAYALGQQISPQAVFCEEDRGDAGEGGASQGGAAVTAGLPREVQALRCRLYTQGPARLDATASGYRPIKDEDLLYKKPYCELETEVQFEPELPDGGE